LGGDVSDRSAASPEQRDDRLLLGRSELVVDDAVAGQRALDGNLIDVVR